VFAARIIINMVFTRQRRRKWRFFGIAASNARGESAGRRYEIDSGARVVPRSIAPGESRGRKGRKTGGQVACTGAKCEIGNIGGVVKRATPGRQAADSGSLALQLPQQRRREPEPFSAGLFLGGDRHG